MCDARARRGNFSNKINSVETIRKLIGAALQLRPIPQTNFGDLLTTFQVGNSLEFKLGEITSFLQVKNKSKEETAKISANSSSKTSLLHDQAAILSEKPGTY